MSKPDPKQAFDVCCQEGMQRWGHVWNDYYHMVKVQKGIFHTSSTTNREKIKHPHIHTLPWVKHFAQVLHTHRSLDPSKHLYSLPLRMTIMDCDKAVSYPLALMCVKSRQWSTLWCQYLVTWCFRPIYYLKMWYTRPSACPEKICAK